MIKFLFCFLGFVLFKLRFWRAINILFLLTMRFLIFGHPIYYNIIFSYCFIDGISFFLILLTGWVVGLMCMSREVLYFKGNFIKVFLVVIILLIGFLFISFIVNNYLLFYIFFEIRLIPTFILILGWGYQPERIQAGLYLLFYTLAASLPLLMGIFFIDGKLLRVRYFFIEDQRSNIFLYFSLLLAFLVKMPMFLVHLWLPKAHVEAPISGSIILARVLLKLGGYGLMRMIPVFLKINVFFSRWWVRLSLYGGTLISLNCLRQIDLKSLIAYSSVAHMGVVLGGLITISYWGFNGCLIIMVAHGLCSSGLFCLANIRYERVHRRRILLNKGMLSFMPRLSLWWFLLRSSNIAAPPSFNLLGEIDLINRLVRWSWISMALIFFLSFFRGAYCLYIFSYRQHGVRVSGRYRALTISIREFKLVALHWVPLNLLFLNRERFLIYLNSLIKY